MDYDKCKDEQEFKMKYIRENLKSPYCKVFCIETEETVKGFPDVMVIVTGEDNTAFFFEFKVSDKSGNIKFQPTQPAFYRANPELKVRVIAYNRKSGFVHSFRANDIFIKGSPYALNSKAKVNLNNAEKEAVNEGTGCKS